MHLKKRPHNGPGIDTFEKPLEKGNRITPGLQSSRGFEDRRRERGRLRRQGSKAPPPGANTILQSSSNAIYLQRRIFTTTNGSFSNRGECGHL